MRVSGVFAPPSSSTLAGGRIYTQGAEIIGDHLYGERLPGWRLMLHAHTLEISLREGEQPRLFEASVPF